MNSSLLPNSTLLATFCNVLAIRVNPLCDESCGTLETIPLDTGATIAGQKYLQKIHCDFIHSLYSKKVWLITIP